jgi:uncharacterized peroxidase-related enzyme
MSWIKTIPYKEAEGSLKKIYDRVKGPNDNVDNVLLIHSLRPHSLQGHMVLYKAVLHHRGNQLAKWYLECLGVYVSHLNTCDYCVSHHFEGLKRLWNDEQRAKLFKQEVDKGEIKSGFSKAELQGFKYAKKLTQNLMDIDKEDVDQLKSLGFSDGEILEINQVCSYFNYANRSVLGLGVSTEGDILGLSPNNSDDPKNWSHK